MNSLKATACAMITGSLYLIIVKYLMNNIIADPVNPAEASLGIIMFVSLHTYFRLGGTK